MEFQLGNFGKLMLIDFYENMYFLFQISFSKLSLDEFSIRILSLLSFPCVHDKCVKIMTWIAYIVLKGRKTPIPPPPPTTTCNLV